MLIQHYANLPRPAHPALKSCLSIWPTSNQSVLIFRGFHNQSASLWQNRKEELLPALKRAQRRLGWENQKNRKWPPAKLLLKRLAYAAVATVLSKIREFFPIKGNEGTAHRLWLFWQHGFVLLTTGFGESLVGQSQGSHVQLMSPQAPIGCLPIERDRGFILSPSKFLWAFYQMDMEGSLEGIPSGEPG